MVRTLLLDLDGTLVDTIPDMAAALNRLMAARELAEFTRDQVAGMVGDGVAVLVTRALAARGLPPDGTAVTAFTADYTAHVAVESQLFPRVLPVLTELVRQGWRLAVCTNKPERAARDLLSAVDLLPLVCAVGAGDSFSTRKPDPGHLLGTLALAHGDAGAAVMLGDHHNDMVAARGAGVPAIFAAWGYGAPGMSEGCVAVAHDVMEAAAIANRLLPAAA